MNQNPVYTSARYPAQYVVYEDEEAELARLEMLAHLMDSAFVIPGTNQRIGLDAIIGLVPILGDTLSAIVSAHIVRRAKKMGVSRVILARMWWNVFVDWSVGLIPFAGDAFDAAWKANKKNVALLRKHLEDKSAIRR